MHGVTPKLKRSLDAPVDGIISGGACAAAPARHVAPDLAFCIYVIIGGVHRGLPGDQGCSFVATGSSHGTASASEADHGCCLGGAEAVGSGLTAPTVWLVEHRSPACELACRGWRHKMDPG